MPYRLHDDLSFCQVDEHLVFLDTRNDRYFRLSSRLERAFLAYIDGGEDVEIDAGALIERGILTTSTTRSSKLAVHVALPVRSAMEQAYRADRISIITLLDVFVTVGLTRLQLARHGLRRILAALIAYRGNRAPPPTKLLTEREAQRLSHTASMFWRARVYVPIEPRCLLDSLAMVKFLAKRRLHANIIFGVSGDPFAAHAWVQVADLVLNDTVGNATAHTPIRVV